MSRISHFVPWQRPKEVFEFHEASVPIRVRDLRDHGACMWITLEEIVTVVLHRYQSSSQSITYGAHPLQQNPRAWARSHLSR
jgi:hypothetical protein